MAKQKIASFLEKIHIPHWLTLLLALVIILRIPNLFEPYSYGDEMIYLTLGEGARQGLTFYKDIHDNKPPLLYYLAAIAGSLFWFKVMLLFWSLLTIVFFWKLCRLIQSNDRLSLIATIIFAIFTTIPLFEGNIANAENFMIGCSVLAFYLLFQKNLTKQKLVFSGIFFGLATLLKVPSIFELPVIFVFWLLTTKKFDRQFIIDFGKKFFLIGIGVSLPILTTFGWYFLKSALPDYLKAAFLQNIGYLSSWRPGDQQLSFFQKNGPVLLRMAVVGFGTSLLFWRRTKLTKAFIFASVWLLFTLFAVTLSERPYPHYFLQSVGAVSILLSLLFTARSLEQVLVFIPLSLAFFVPFYFKFYYYRTGFYYSRFLQFALHQTTKEEYFNTFDGTVNRNYEIADFISKNSLSSDKVFVVGDASPIYALSKRLPPFKFVANYHISEFSSTQELITALQKNNPKYIVILSGEKIFPELGNLLAKNYLVIVTKDYQVWYLKNAK